MASDRPSTPPSVATISNPGILPRSPLTPEQIKKIVKQTQDFLHAPASPLLTTPIAQEISRLKAKALRQQLEAEYRKTNPPPLPTSLSRSSSNLAAGAKRTHSSISTSHTPTTVRDGRQNNNAGASNPTSGGGGGSSRPLDDIRPARSMARYVEYDFSKMTDTKGGFLTAEDDPHNKALHAGPLDGKPGHMSLKEWERYQLLRSLRENRSGPFEPGIGLLHNKKAKVCRECNSLEIDYKWLDVFKCEVCNSCKEKYPEKYSLLTKTEAREDYLLTDPELKDEELLPHLVRPNPHRATWNNMMLFLRYQVEDYAFSEKKWGSPEKLDEEFTRREVGKKKKKEEKRKNKLQELKKRTRVEAYRRKRENGGGAGGAKFGDVVGREGTHVHDWMRTVVNEEGVGIKQCADCGMEVEELEF